MAAPIGRTQEPFTSTSKSQTSEMKVMLLMLCGFAARIGLLLYGEWQDRTMAVKYTDVDYLVFTDAARHMTKGESPYLRATYRYTPLLAWSLQPNIWLSAAFGKVLFILFDIATGYLIYRIAAVSGASTDTANICGAVWLFNPLPMTVSSRGNAESIMSFLVLWSMKLLLDRRVALAGAIYALSVHVKIYPVTYAIPIYLLLGNDYYSRDSDGHYYGDGNGYAGKEAVDMGTRIKQYFVKCIWPTKDRIVFVAVAAVVFCCFTGLYYYWYGWEFLHHTYLYHVTRKDIRHNFSVYFYMLYQQTGADNSVFIGLVTFLPQVALLLVFSFKYYRHPQLVFFINTFVFVTFNKVCTSQYFLWYLCLLPPLIPHLKFNHRTTMILIALWFGGQGMWLLPAYYLEFEGINTFLLIWLAGLAFFTINCYILSNIIGKYIPVQQTVTKQDKDTLGYQRGDRQYKDILLSKSGHISSYVDVNKRAMSTHSQRNKYYDPDSERYSGGDTVRERIWTRSRARKPTEN